ncbi:MAG TPA: M56 family metallopeptidase [Blastocatellia bacterium]|nr:M56 family metallopeptidase [Blastocatellia bacterium]
MSRANSLHQIISAAFDSPAGLLALWAVQTLIVLGIAWAAVAFDRSQTSGTRCRIWLFALTVCGLLPALNFFFRTLPAPNQPIVATFSGTVQPLLASAPPVAAYHISAWDIATLWVLPALWLAGVGVALARLAVSMLKLRKMRLAAKPASLADLGCAHESKIAGETGRRRAEPSIALSGEIKSPGLAGLFRPTILLPADIASWTTPDEVTAIIRHETAHIERRDHISGLFVSILRALLFFHPMVHLASNRIGLERELACDDRALGLGAQPKPYAESILKAVERSILVDAVHQAPSFASRKTLERRLEMILNENRSAPPGRQWRFLMLPIAVILVVTWLAMPPGAGVRRVAAASSSAGTGWLSALYARVLHKAPTSEPVQKQHEAIISKDTIWVDTVKRGDLTRKVRGLGTVTSAETTGLKAEIMLPVEVSKDVKIGQPAVVQDKKGRKTAGTVSDVDHMAHDGVLTVELELEPDTTGAIKPGVNIDGIIQIGQLNDVLYVGRPVVGHPLSIGTVFKIDADGKSAKRVQVEFGESSVNQIQILSGLAEGDRVILSDMSEVDGVDRIKLR